MSAPARRPRWHRLLNATSQWLNVAIFDGDENHSVSGDAYRLGRPRVRRFIDRLFARWELGHCEASYLAEVAQQQAFVAEHAKRISNSHAPR